MAKKLLSLTALLLSGLLSLLLLCACNPQPPVTPEPAQPEAQPQLDPADIYDRVIHTAAGYVGVNNASEDIDGGALELRAYVLDNSDNVVMGRYTPQAFAVGAEPKQGGEYLQLSLGFVSGGVISSWQPEQEQWYVTDLTAGAYYSGAVFIDSPECSLFYYLPRSYRHIDRGSLQYLPEGDGWLQADYVDGGFSLTLCAPWPAADCVVDFLLVNSGEALVDWDYGDAYTLWSAYTQDGEGRWCYDGYYWPTDDDYLPSGEDHYFWHPSCYLIGSMLAIANHHRLAADLALAMLDTVALGQNEQGYFPSLFTSGWLSGDYGVAAGYYDTRWNSDLLSHFARGYSQTGADLFLRVMNSYIDFYLDFAQLNHIETANGGWLVAACGPYDEQRPCHTSLNHQLSEAALLYQLAQVLVRDDLLALADRLILGLSDTEQLWLSADGNLNYGLLADGSAVGVDYPYLTYNDLYEVQNLLQQLYGQRNPALERLMLSKRAWMEANEVNGYKGQVTQGEAASE